MTGPIIAGNPEPVEMPQESTVRRVGGSEYIRRWRHTVETLESWRQSVVNGGASEVTIQPDGNGVMGTMIARYSAPVNGQPEVAQETVEVSFNDVTLKLHENPAFINITSARIKALDDLVSQDNPTAPTDATELQYFNLRRRGQSDYRAKLPVITYTRTVSATYSDGLDSVADCGTIFDAPNVPAPILFALPTANVGVSAGGDYSVGWMLDSRVAFNSDGTVQLVESWEYGIWPTVAHTFGS